MNIAGKWGHSHDGEYYTGAYDTREEAVAEARAVENRFVGQFRDPQAPEDCIDADDLLEKSACQDDYEGDWADGWPDATAEQRKELTTAVQKVYGEWLDKHGLRPKWGMVENGEEIGDEI